MLNVQKLDCKLILKTAIIIFVIVDLPLWLMTYFIGDADNFGMFSLSIFLIMGLMILMILVRILNNIYYSLNHHILLQLCLVGVFYSLLSHVFLFARGSEIELDIKGSVWIFVLILIVYCCNRYVRKKHNL